MKRFLTLLVFAGAWSVAYSQKDCRYLDYQKQLLSEHPEYINAIQSVRDFTRQTIQNRHELQVFSSSDTLGHAPSVITIPVVVHILYNGAGENISDAQVISQIAVLNADYSRTNADTVNTPAAFRPVAANCEFQFALARVDPQGFATTGIIHKATTIQMFGIDDRIKYSSKGGDDAWDCDRYLNIWIGNLSGGIIGYSSIPGGPKDRDGVAIIPAAFGTTGAATAPFNKGRTATHEIGHWLNMIHVWGDTFCGDDQVADTPPQQGPTRGCPSALHVSCGNAPYGDMYSNYMDLTDDACMNLFTSGQKERMRVLFAPGGFRNAMLSSDALTAIPKNNPADAHLPVQNFPKINVYPNPAQGIITVEIPETMGLQSTLKVINGMGQPVLSLRVNQHLQQLDVSSLRSGIYYISIDDGSNRVMSKLMKM